MVTPPCTRCQRGQPSSLHSTVTSADGLSSLLRFILKIPAGYPLEAAGPVLCAGITMFTPLVKFSADKGGLRVGVVGIGGLGKTEAI